jgi:hypothetical protein
LVVVSRVPRVAVFVTVTLAPGIAAPDESVTVPVIPPCVCARPVTTHDESRISTVRRRASERDLCLMFSPQSLASMDSELLHAP